MTLDASPLTGTLVADDEPSVREAFEVALAAKGYEVVLSKDRHRDIRILRQER